MKDISLGSTSKLIAPKINGPAPVTSKTIQLVGSSISNMMSASYFGTLVFLYTQITFDNNFYVNHIILPVQHISSSTSI